MRLNLLRISMAMFPGLRNVRIGDSRHKTLMGAAWHHEAPAPTYGEPIPLLYPEDDTKLSDNARDYDYDHDISDVRFFENYEQRIQQGEHMRRVCIGTTVFIALCILAYLIDHPPFGGKQPEPERVFLVERSGPNVY
jgi:hypothetical protein